MRALHLDQVSPNPEVPKTKDQQFIKGADVFGWNLLSALLQYGTYDAYLAEGLTEQKKQLLLEGGLTADHIKRLVPAPSGRPLPIRDSDQLVFLTGGRYLNVLSTVRYRLKRYDAPVCGFIHSINSARIAFSLLQQCFAGLSEADLLFCSSRAGMKAIDVYVEAINSLLPPELQYPVRRVLVPLGVHVPATLQEAGGRLRQKLSIEERVSIGLYFGRLSQGSKCDLGPLFVALLWALKRCNNLCLIIAGDDRQSNEAPRLQALANELGCQNSVRIWPDPSSEEKHLLYSGANFFVSPSDNMQETFGLAVAEAMAYGLPAIVSDWDGYRDLVEDGENGFLVPSILPPTVEYLRLCDCVMSMSEEDLVAQSTTIDVRALSERMKKLAGDQSLQARMGQAARRFIESHCSWPIVVRRYEELWEESLKMARVSISHYSQSSRLLNLSLQECFGHYASATRNHEQGCVVTAEGQEWLKRPGRFYFLGPSLASPSPKRFADMLREISRCPGISVAKIVETFSHASETTDPEPASVEGAQWTLARLFKYGLVAPAQEAAADEASEQQRIESTL